MADAERRAHEVENLAGIRIHLRRVIFLEPAVVVSVNGAKDGVAPRFGSQRRAGLHDGASQVRVIWLSDQLEPFRKTTDDHGRISGHRKGHTEG